MSQHRNDSDPPFQKNSFHGISSDAIAVHLENLNTGQAEARREIKEMREEMKTLSLAVATGAKECPMLSQCRDVVSDVKDIQQDRYKAKGVLVSIGMGCALVGWVVGELMSWFKK